MRKNHIYRITILIAVFMLIAIFYCYQIFKFHISKTEALLYLSFVWVVTTYIMLFLRKFLKYYFNFKDKSNLITIIIIGEFFQILFMLIIVNEYTYSESIVFFFNVLLLLSSVILAISYILFAAKMLGFSHGQSRKLIPLSYIMIIGQVLVLIIMLFFNYVGDTVMTTAKTDIKTFIISFNKIAQFAMMPYIFFTGYKRKRY